MTTLLRRTTKTHFDSEASNAFAGTNAAILTDVPSLAMKLSDGNVREFPMDKEVSGYEALDEYEAVDGETGVVVKLDGRAYEKVVPEPVRLWDTKLTKVGMGHMPVSRSHEIFTLKHRSQQALRARAARRKLRCEAERLEISKTLQVRFLTSPWAGVVMALALIASVILMIRLFVPSS